MAVDVRLQFDRLVGDADYKRMMVFEMCKKFFTHLSSQKIFVELLTEGAKNGAHKVEGKHECN